MLIAFVVGIIYGYRKSKEPFGDWFDILAWSFLVPAGVGVFMFFMALLLVGVGFLFS